MADSLKNIRIRIRSIKNTKKVTKAMELVSANKMRKASRLAIANKPYDFSVSKVVKAILETEPNSDYFRKSDKNNKNIAIIIFSSNRGLCGSFNSDIISKTRLEVLKKFPNEKINWISVGKKGSILLSKNGEKVFAEFKKIESGEDSFEFFNIARFLTKEFVEKRFDEVWFAYTDFVSSIKQIPRLKRLLPLQEDILENNVDNLNKKLTQEIKFEPSGQEVLSFLVPRLIESKLYHALLESNASEHSARMLSMKNASDASQELIDGLVFKSNELRQSSITKEIIEIAGAKSAIETSF